MTLSDAVATRAAELRAGAVPATDLPPPPHPDMELSGRMTIAGVRHRDGRAFKMVGAEGVGGRTNTVVIVVDDAVPASEPKPEPAAEPSIIDRMKRSCDMMLAEIEPSEVDSLLRQGHESLTAGAVIVSVRSALMAVEALAREVRHRAGGAS